ncbi:conserved hypothetical protein [Gammaproteobacteria bacterium]
MRNWKTTTAGISTIIAALAGAIALVVDGDPKTNPQWELVVGAVITGLGLVLAKDFNVTGAAGGQKTEDGGRKTEDKV